MSAIEIVVTVVFGVPILLLSTLFVAFAARMQKEVSECR